MLECGMKSIRGEALFVCDKMAYCEMLEITMMVTLFNVFVFRYIV